MNPGSDWVMGGMQYDEPAPADGWRPGLNHRTVEVVCCPECGSTNQQRRNVTSQIAYWACKDCGIAHKSSSDVGVSACRRY